MVIEENKMRLGIKRIVGEYLEENCREGND
jgi:hypothetical protein